MVSGLTVSQTGTRSRIPLFLGFFMQPHVAMYEVNKDAPSAKFIYCSEEGKGLQDGEWGSFDASLSFLNMPRKHIVGSSNGILLCCPDFLEKNSHFVVCNPVTREYNVLPRPHKVYRCVALTFICKGNDGGRASLDRINYEILRVGNPNSRSFSTTYEMETFSSLTGEWKLSHLVSLLPFNLHWTNVPGFVLDDVIYWKDEREFLLVYDRSKAEDQAENMQRLELPRDDKKITLTFCMCTCEGKIHYVRSTNGCHIEVWSLLDYKRAEWVLLHKVSFTEINQNNSSYHVHDVNVGYLHPWNSHLLFLQTYENLYWYDFGSGKLHKIASRDNIYNIFLYEWPCAPNSSTVSCHESHSRL